MKKICLISVLTAAILLSACAYGTTDAPVESMAETASVESVTIPKESDSQFTTTKTEATETAPKYKESAINSESSAEVSDEINSQDINSFTSKIKQTFASKDLEALADLCGYPVYVSLQNGKGIEVNSRQAFLDLGSENIFTNSLSETIKSIDPQTLEVFGAGVILGENANIIFNKVDGRLMITGINI